MGAERYVILGTLGKDPTGTAFLALESELDQRVVYKQFAPQLAGEQGFMDGFRQEARIMALFDHPNLVCVLDLFVEDQAVVVTEYVRGASLREAVEVGGRFTPAQALGTLKGVLRGLAYAHDLGLVHRDVRPENVLVDGEGVPKLTAFGHSTKVLSRNQVRDIPGRIASYMSPERLAGGPVGPLADIYSCGALLYKLLTGEAPYEGKDLPAVLRRQIDGPEPDPGLQVRGLPEEISALVTRAMATAPEERPESADLFLHELEAAAVATYGADWEHGASIKRLVATSAAMSGSGLSLDDDAQTQESIEDLDDDSVTPARRYAAIGAAMLVLFASAAGLAYSRGFITWPGTRPTAVVSPVAEASASPTAEISPSPAPTGAPVVIPTPGPEVNVSVSNPVVWFQACADAQATQCGAPIDGSAYGETKPFNASAFGALRLIDTFSWTYGSASGPPPVEATINWAASAELGSGGSYPATSFTRLLAFPSGVQTADSSGREVVVSADAPSKSAATFRVTYIDSGGDHVAGSRTFYWTH